MYPFAAPHMRSYYRSSSNSINSSVPQLPSAVQGLQNSHPNAPSDSDIVNKTSSLSSAKAALNGAFEQLQAAVHNLPQVDVHTVQTALSNSAANWQVAGTGHCSSQLHQLVL